MSFLAAAQYRSADSISEEALGSLRTRLDEIDRILLDTVRDRIRCCIDIAAVKRNYNIPMMQPHRVGLVHQRAAAYAAANALNPAFMHSLYELIIGETCRVESVVIDQPAH
jgi:chorismate mutase-like protein